MIGRGRGTLRVGRPGVLGELVEAMAVLGREVEAVQSPGRPPIAPSVVPTVCSHLMHLISRLLREATRRNLLGTIGIFIGGSWVALQALDLFIEQGLLPDWTFRGALLALVLGLPVVLATAYIEGGRRLEAAGEGETSETEGDLARLLTWNRAILGGVLAFALLGVLTAGYMVMRVTGIGVPGTLAAQGAFEVGGQVVVADFESSVGEAAPGDLITEALRIDLEQSLAFDLVEKADVVKTQRLMRLDPAEPLTEAVAREVAIRMGVDGVISGEIGRVGSSYVLTARLIAPESGAVLAPFRETARDSTELLQAIDGLASRMREKVGESLRSVAGAESLSTATTSSLDALRKYTHVSSRIYRSAIDFRVAQQLLEEAVALDSTFAMANLSLSIAISNWGGSTERAWQATSAAYRHRDRLSERERNVVEAYYHKHAGDTRAAMQSYRRILEIDPTYTAAAVNLADISIYAGDYEGAVELLRATPIRGNTVWAWNLMTALAGLGRLDEALAVNDTLGMDIPGTLDIYWARALLLATSGELEAARGVLARAPQPTPDRATWASSVTAITEVLGGRVAPFREQMAGSLALAERHLSVPEQIDIALYFPLVAAWIERDTAGVARELDAALSGVDFGSTSSLDRRYPTQALLFALVGNRARVDDLLQRYAGEVAAASDAEGRARAAVARALVAVRPGEGAALAELERALDGMVCARCRDALRGHAYDTALRPAEAIEAYERYLAHPFFDSSEALTHVLAATVHERLGDLYVATGDSQRAAGHYRIFVELWHDSDPVFRDRVARARARAGVADQG